MVDTPDLDTLLGIGVAPTQEEKNDKLGARLLTVREQIKALKDEERAIEDAIWTQTPEEPGEFAVEGTQFSFTVARSELWKWESSKLELLASNPAIESCIDTTHTIKRKAAQGLFAQLPPAEIKLLEDALTRKPGAPRVKVIRKP